MGQDLRCLLGVLFTLNFCRGICHNLINILFNILSCSKNKYKVPMSLWLVENNHGFNISKMTEAKIGDILLGALSYVANRPFLWLLQFSRMVLNGDNGREIRLFLCYV
jgi:hypothetical protein